MNNTNAYALLIEGDPTYSLGGGCSRDLWNYAQLLFKNDLIQEEHLIICFFKEDLWIQKLKLLYPNAEFVHFYSPSDFFIIVTRVVTLLNSLLVENVLYFHYSGHGFQVRDTNGDELDGMDKAILQGQVLDDHIYKSLIEPLSSYSTVFATMDACHSGTAVDLPFQFDPVKGWVPAKRNTSSPQCTAWSISACADHQLASQDIGDKSGFGGSLTTHLCDLGNKYKTFLKNPLLLRDHLQSILNGLHQIVILSSNKMH